MSGLTDYSADAQLNWLTGSVAMPPLPSVWMALFTGVGNDSGAGFAEVATAGTGYARAQVAGNLTTSAPTAVGNAVLNFAAAVPAWVVPGMRVFDLTSGAAIPAGTSVLSVTGSTVTMSNNAAAPGVGTGDSIRFTAFGSPSGSAPSQISNSGQINFPTATATWGTVLGFGLYDAAAAGNLLDWDYLGNFVWQPSTVSAASPAVITSHNHNFSAGDPVVWSIEFGGVSPTFSQSNFTGVLVVTAPVTADTYTVTNGGTAVNTSGTGSGSMRKIIQQQVPTGVTASFIAGAMILTAA
jgi:hypothetical protein